MPFQTGDGKLFYRIGDVIVSTNGDNPSKMYGGTWELLCPGKTLVCVDTKDSDFNVVNKIGGEKMHLLSAAEMPLHSHTTSIGNAGSHNHHMFGTSPISNPPAMPYTNGYISRYAGASTSDMTYSVRNSDSATIGINETAGMHSHSINIGSSGLGQYHNNLQPFMVVYMWVRVG